MVVTHIPTFAGAELLSTAYEREEAGGEDDELER
jgi:hypothetical protein